MSRAGRRGRGLRIAFGLFAAALLVVAAEAGLRVAGVEPSGFVYPRPEGWRLPPEERRRVDQPDPQPDFDVHTNVDGLRSPLGRAPRPGVRRAGVVGDSTVFGWGVDEADALPARLAEALGAGWEVLNGGQPGYSSEQILRLVDRVIASYSLDDLVVVCPMHDLLDADRPDAEWLDDTPLAPLEWLRVNSSLYRAIRGAREEARANGPGPRRPPANPDDPDRVTRVPPARRAEVRAALVARVAPARVWFTVLPSDHDLRRGPGPQNAMAREVSTWAATAGARFIDLSRAFPAGTAVEDVTLPGDTGHYNRAGSDRIAAVIAAALGAE